MSTSITQEAIALLLRLRQRADRDMALLPTLAGVSSGCTAAALSLARHSLERAGYYDVSISDEAGVRAARVAAIDRAIAKLEAA